MATLAQMENRAVMAETMLEATLQYQSSQQKALSPCPSPRTSMLDASPSQASQTSSQEFQPRRKNLLGPFSLSWRDKNKEKQNNADDSTNTKFSNNNDETVETSNKDDEKQRETLEIDSEQRTESTEEDGKLRAEMPEKDNELELPGVQIAMSNLNGQHEQMQEIKLD